MPPARESGIAPAAFRAENGVIRTQGLIYSTGSSGCLLVGSGPAGNRRSSSFAVIREWVGHDSDAMIKHYMAKWQSSNPSFVLKIA
jgi:hypothetical protein